MNSVLKLRRALPIVNPPGQHHTTLIPRKPGVQFLGFTSVLRGKAGCPRDQKRGMETGIWAVSGRIMRGLSSLRLGPRRYKSGCSTSGLMVQRTLTVSYSCNWAGDTADFVAASGGAHVAMGRGPDVRCRSRDVWRD